MGLRALGQGAPSSGARCSELKASLLRAPAQGARSAASLAAEPGSIKIGEYPQLIGSNLKLEANGKESVVESNEVSAVAVAAA